MASMKTKRAAEQKDAPLKRDDGKRRDDMLRKRSKTLFKKSAELAEYCKVSIAVILYDPKRQKYRVLRTSRRPSWPPSMEKIRRCCPTFEDDVRDYPARASNWRADDDTDGDDDNDDNYDDDDDDDTSPASREDQVEETITVDQGRDDNAGYDVYDGPSDEDPPPEGGGSGMTPPELLVYRDPKNQEDKSPAVINPGRLVTARHATIEVSQSTLPPVSGLPRTARTQGLGPVPALLPPPVWERHGNVRKSSFRLLPEPPAWKGGFAMTMSVPFPPSVSRADVL